MQRLVRSSILLQIKLNKIEFRCAGIPSTFLFSFVLSSSSGGGERAQLQLTNQPLALFLSAPLCIQLALLKWRGAKVSLYLKGEKMLQLPLDAGEYLFFNFITLKLIEYLLPLLYLARLPSLMPLRLRQPTVARLFYFCASAPRLTQAKLS